MVQIVTHVGEIGTRSADFVQYLQAFPDAHVADMGGVTQGVEDHRIHALDNLKCGGWEVGAVGGVGEGASGTVEAEPVGRIAPVLHLKRRNPERPNLRAGQ